MMKVDIVVVIVTLVLCYHHYRLPEEENCSFAFVKDQKQDEMMMIVSGDDVNSSVFKYIFL